ncbi:Protein C15C8.5, partial [Aphelenchoides avenae]
MCNNCRTYEKDVGCDQECEGDFCVLWKYTEMSIDHRIQGCMKGVDYSRIPMGCQTNKVDATLCLCNSTDFCNSEAVQFPSGGAQPIAQIEVPTTKCQSSTEAPYIPKSAKASQFTQCLSDYCFFTQTNTSNIKDEYEMLTSRSCGQMPQFNFEFLVGSLWPGPGLM